MFDSSARISSKLTEQEFGRLSERCLLLRFLIYSPAGSGGFQFSPLANLALCLSPFPLAFFQVDSAKFSNILG